MLSPDMPLRLSIHAVTVVPILAPIITDMDCLRLITPEFTNPTTITVVADELCITAVTPRPVKSPLILPDVSFPIIISSLPPALRSSALPITFIPKRKRHSPPISDKTSKISIHCLLCYFFRYTDILSFYASFCYHSHI